MEYLSPWEIASYQGRKDALSTNYQNTLAQSEYTRSRARLRSNMNMDQIGQSFDRQRQAMPGSFVSRGLYGRSGIWNGALQDYATARQRAIGMEQFNLADTLGQSNLNDQNAGATYNTGLADVAAQMAARRAELASQLRSIA